MRIISKLRPSLAVGVLAAFAVGGGTAVAAGEIITSPGQVKNGVLTEPKLADDAVSARTVGDDAVRLQHLAQPVLATGVNKGVSPGSPPFLINPTNEVESVRNTGVNHNSGTYVVRFSEPVRHCQWAATPAAIEGQGNGATFLSVRPSKFDTKEVFVFANQLQTVGSNKGSAIPGPASFYLLGRC